MPTVKNTEKGKSTKQSGKRGFAAMSPEQRKAIARKGGKASHGGKGRNQ